MRRCRAPLSIPEKEMAAINSRIVVLGNRQKQKFDFDLYSPTVSMAAARFQLVDGASRGYDLLQADVENAFLKASL